MRIETVWLLQMGMSGIFFPETDIGGHWPTGELTDELFIRWAFLATFSPIMRSHGHNWRCRLPWGFGPENEARFVPLIKLRSAMFPYNYTLLAEANRTGMPMMRALVLAYPDDPIARKTWDAVHVGAGSAGRSGLRQGCTGARGLPAGRERGSTTGRWARTRDRRRSASMRRSARTRCSCAQAASSRCEPIPTPSPSEADEPAPAARGAGRPGGFVHALRRRSGDLSLRARRIVLADVPRRAARPLGLVQPFHRRDRRRLIGAGGRCGTTASRYRNPSLRRRVFPSAAARSRLPKDRAQLPLRHWQSLADRSVVILEKIEGPALVEFRSS